VTSTVVVNEPDAVERRLVALAWSASYGQLSHLFEICSSSRFECGEDGDATEHERMIEATARAVRRNLRSQDNVTR
jgi:hypothetical protein